MEIKASHICTSGLIQADALQYEINQVRMNHSIGLKVAIRSERLRFAIDNIQSDSPIETLHIYLYGTCGECIKTFISLGQKKGKRIFTFGKDLVELCRQMHKESIDICRIGFSTLKSDVTFSVSKV